MDVETNNLELGVPMNQIVIVSSKNSSPRKISGDTISYSETKPCCGEKLSLPSNTDMMKNLAAAGKDILASPRLSPPEILQQRVEMCDTCGFMTKEGRCGNTEIDKRGCGCFMKIKAKFKALKCPRGLWEE